jgi:purine-nucleoside phosphorylase
LAIVLGTGFQYALSRLAVNARAPYKQLPGFPRLSVSGHRGELLIGKLGGTPVLVLSGRAHYYEGHLMEAVTFPIRVLAAYGIRDLLLTNAAGGINPKFRPGDFMVLADHINLIGSNPLRGTTVDADSRFVDLTTTYAQELRRLMLRAARRCAVRLHSGIYLAVSGPSYETPAEIRAFATLGADAVGMSTVPEATVARQCGLRVAGLSCITNPAAGLHSRPLSHTEVLQTAQRVEHLMADLVEKFAELYRSAAAGSATTAGLRLL